MYYYSLCHSHKYGSDNYVFKSERKGVTILTDSELEKLGVAFDADKNELLYVIPLDFKPEVPEL